ncbi:hypothetical protein RRG08_040160 [Elysia crispata]|uniref:Uncharacterized protein n=1 Tax=Elysia crispata TaxID=231223 RepID=A0AAE0XWA1_9GAST|nr:hypothetical protein RRG08_040160 [Elysia crispata]
MEKDDVDDDEDENGDDTAALQRVGGALCADDIISLATGRCCLPWGPGDRATLALKEFLILRGHQSEEISVFE